MNLINRSNNKIKQFVKTKIIHIFLVIVLAVAINHIVFSYLLINRETAKALDIFGNALIGTNNYQQTSLEYLEKLQLYSEIEKVNFALLDQANGYVYFAIERADQKSLLIKFDLATFTRIDELMVADYLIKTGVIDQVNGLAYLGAEAENEGLGAKYKIIKLDLATFTIAGAIDLLPEDIITNPQIDQINKIVYYMNSDESGTRLLKINIAPDNFKREGIISVGTGNKSLTYAHSLVFQPQKDKGFIYLANQTQIAIIDLAKFNLVQQVNSPQIIYKLLGVDQELGYLYYSTKYVYKYTQLKRINLASLLFVIKILN